MKTPFFSRFSKSKVSKKEPEKTIATPDDIRRKLENYKKKDGPARFGSAGVYYVNEVDDQPPSGKTPNPGEPDTD